MNTRFHSDLIDMCGGTGQVAELFGLRSQAVSMWHRRGIPDPWLRCLKNERPAEYQRWLESHPQKGAA